MRIVIITGVIYPQISARSFRGTELAKGLANMGHQVSLYAILGSYDYSKIQTKNLIIKNLGKSKWGNVDSDGVVKRSLLNRFLQRILYNILDYPRIEYLFKAYKALCNEQPFDLLITIAHPFGIHWGAAFFKRKYPNKFKKWISDCGDPFLGDPDVKRFRLILEPLEKFWCTSTDLIAVPVESAKTAYHHDYENKIIVIPQGISFDSIKLEDYKCNTIPTFLYSGAVYPEMRDPRQFLEYLSTYDEDFKFYVYAPSDKIFRDFKNKLGHRMVINRYIPRLDLIKIMSKMDFLINIQNDSTVQIPSKLIDYSLARRPILNVSTTLSDIEKASIDSFLKGDYSSRYIVNNIERYDSKNVCKQFIDAYETL